MKILKIPTIKDQLDDIHYRMDSGPAPKRTGSKIVDISWLVKIIARIFRRKSC